MSTPRWHFGLSLLAALLTAACFDVSGWENLGPLEVEVRYHGSIEGRPLEALILHSELDNYDEAENLLDAPLEVDDATRWTDIPPGNWYITVIRKQRPLPHSPRVALTTAEPVYFHSGRHEILVFDDFFRLLDPVQTEEATPKFELQDLRPGDAGCAPCH